MASNYNNKSIVFTGLSICLDAANDASYNRSSFGKVVNAQTSFTSPGSQTFTVPVGVTSISAVCIGGGGAGGSQSSSEGAGGGGGGGLAYGTIPVTSNQSLTLWIGEGGECPDTSSDGGDGQVSYIKSDNSPSAQIYLQGGGGEGGEYAGTGAGGEGGDSTGVYRTGGGTGGNGGNGGSDNGGGGGGAAGYEGNGGNGSGSAEGADGAGGGGGGAGANTTGAKREGGGVGFFGEGSNGEGGESNQEGLPGSGGLANLFGGGGGGAKRISGLAGDDGADGAIRIVYQQPSIGDRQYPTLANIADATYNTSSAMWNDLVKKKTGRQGTECNLYGPIYNSDDGGSLVFNGSSDYAFLRPGSETLFGTGAFAVELWVRFSGAGTWYFLDTRIGGLDMETWAIYMETNERILWYQGDGTSCFNTSDMPTWSTGDNGWNHIVFSREGTGSNEFKAYVNGEHKASDTDDINYDGMPFYTELRIGCRYSNTEFMNGRISTLRIYNGYALSAAEVLQNYNATKRRFGL